MFQSRDITRWPNIKFYRARGARMPEHDELVTLTAQITAAHVSRNDVPTTELPNLISIVHQALATAGKQVIIEKPKPAVSIKKSVTKDSIVCLECGKGQKTLKRHLNAKHDLTPEQYRERFNLPGDYPFTAPSYSAQRSKMAKSIGFGTKGRGKRKKPAKRK